MFNLNIKIIKTEKSKNHIRNRRNVQDAIELCKDVILILKN